MRIPGSGRARFAAFVVGVVAASLAAAADTSAVATSFSLTFDGAHPVDPTLPAGLRHDGRFTASAPFCSAGRAYDVRQADSADRLDVERLHICDDGSGSFTAFMPNVRHEHGAGTGTWRIIEGTGRYATLRGFGSYTGTLLSGDPDVFETISYRTRWQGVVALDADPPAIERFTVSSSPRPVGTYTLRVALLTRDASTPVSYRVDVRAGGIILASKQGSTASGQATLTLRIRPSRTTRTARITLTARDAVRNASTAARSIRLR